MLFMVSLIAYAGASGQTGVYVHDEEFPFIVVSKDTVTVPPTFTDREFKDAATAVYFKVNKSAIKDGDEFFSLYNDVILPRINGQHLQLRKIYVRGAASPEGPYANNVRLGRERTQALLRALMAGLAHQYEEVDQQVSAVTEDYGFLCLLMEEAGDPDYDVVKNIYDECDGDEPCCKKKLMAAQGGKLWKRLLKEYFPRLRAARMVLWFTEPDEAHAPEPPLPTFGIEVADSLDHRWGEPIDILPGGDLSYVSEPVDYTRRHLIAARTNLVHDFFVMPGFGFAPSPNIQFEYYPLGGHYTGNVGITWGTWRKWNTHEFWQVRDIQAEVRRYFVGHGEFIGPYLGLYAHGGKYGIGLDEKKGWQGEYGGAGLTGGYTMALNKKGNFRLEFMASLGCIVTRFDPYVYGNPITGTIDGDYYYNYLGSASEFKRRNHQLVWWGPTNLGIQLTYDIIYRKRHKK